MKGDKMKKDRILEIINDPNAESWCLSWEKSLAYDLVEQALDKTEEIKPTELNENMGYFTCGSCSAVIAYLDDYDSHKYCLSCGQKLDWIID